MIHTAFIHQGKERGMYYIWLAVLVLAVIPIRIGHPLINLPLHKPQQNIVEFQSTRYPSSTINSAKIDESADKYKQSNETDESAVHYILNGDNSNQKTESFLSHSEKENLIISLS